MTQAKKCIRAAGALMLAFALFSCGEPVLLLRPDNTGHYESSLRLAEIFDRFWQAMNNNYVYWDVESVDYWDGVYNAYMPRFESMGLLIAQGTKVIDDDDNLVDVGNADKALALFKEMTAPLHDGHLTISFNSVYFDPPAEAVLIPNEDRVRLRPSADASRIFLSDWSSSAGNPNLWREMIRKYMTYPDGDDIDTYTLDPRCRLLAATGKISMSDPEDSEGYIAYLYFNKFMIYETITSESSQASRPVTTVMERFMSAIYQPGLRAVIFDVRGNTGGSNIDISYLLSPFLHDDLLIAYTRSKSGPAPLDYLPWAPYHIPAAPPYQRVPDKTLPIAVLCNDYSVSSAELLTLAAHATARGSSFGVRTWGALGPRLSSTSPLLSNGGSFSGSPFWLSVVQAGFQTRGPDKSNYDGVGVAPKQEVPFSYAANAPDSQLEAAILWIDPAHSFSSRSYKESRPSRAQASSMPAR